MALSSSLALVARMMGLDAADAIALPTVITVCARKAGMTEPALLREVAANDALRDYLARLCRVAIAEVAA